jgi:hypothetical protein
VRALWRLLTRRRSQTVFVIGLPLAVLGAIAVAFAWSDRAPSSVERGVTSRALEAEARAIAPRDGALLLSSRYRPAPCTGGDGSTAPENILRVEHQVDAPPAEVMATTRREHTDGGGLQATRRDGRGARSAPIGCCSTEGPTASVTWTSS